MANERRGIVQTRNPMTDRYLKIDRDKGIIISTKKSEGPYKNVEVVDNVE